jgi:AraC-like DNA-binding protein
VLSMFRPIMSSMRQYEPPVRGYAVTHPRGDVEMPSQPGWQQLVYAVSGGLVARTTSDSWTLPPHRALCIGDETRIRIWTTRPTAVRVLYFDAGLGALEAAVRIVSVPPLARELILRAVDTSPLNLDDANTAALYRLLVDEVDKLPSVPLQLSLPADERLVELTDRILGSPAEPLTHQLAQVAASRRNCERLIRRETGLTLASWQRRARVLAAIELLIEGASVTRTAVSVGYSTPSAFVVAFRAETGCTPTAFLAQP